MKTLVLGDTHGRSVWKLIAQKEMPNRIIFIGDYFDSFDIPGLDQIHNFKEIVHYKETNPQVEVVMLIGNHDYHYFPEIGDTGTSGFQRNLFFSISQVINENRHHLQMAYQLDEFLFTHAGVSSVFMDESFGADGWKVETIAEQLNDLFKYKPKTFEFNGMNPYGDDIYQTPIWIRPHSLMKVNYETLRKKVVQVVGHTGVTQIDAGGKATGNRYWFIDALGTSGEYLVLQDNKVIVNSIK